MDSTAEATATASDPTAQPDAGLGWDPAWLQRGRQQSPSRGDRRRSSTRRPSITRAAGPSGKVWWKFNLRPWDDDDERDWWFASTAVPLLAATLGPLANVLSIAALVTYWRMCLVDGTDPAVCEWNGDPNVLVSQLSGHTYEDPHWCYWLNVASLILGFVGNIFLLFNFTNRIRYIIALPVTIVMWYLATAFLIAITVSMAQYQSPQGPQQVYTEGFWYGVIAAVIYMVCSMILMVNMLGYFLGHYPQTFTLTDSQRTLILQTMLFFIWLAGGAAVFSRVETDEGQNLFNWSFVNALYFCDVTILTVGFGDLYPLSNEGRGLVFPYSVGGIIMLGLTISSITNFVAELGTDNVIQKHFERTRTRTIGRTVSNSMELHERQRQMLNSGVRPTISEPFNAQDRSTALSIKEPSDIPTEDTSHGPVTVLRRVATLPMSALGVRPKKRAPRLLLLREQKDRFDTMRRLQAKTHRWKRWYGLTSSIIAFGVLWCVGAVVFWRCEHDTQGMTYFQALYFCYVSLLTIGYGDLAPKSNAGRPFFVVWSLIAVPTMTILISDMGDTVISSFKRGTFRLADFTVLPEKGIWRNFLLSHPWLYSWLVRFTEQRAAKKRLAKGFETGPDPDEEAAIDAHKAPSLDALAKQEDSLDETEMAIKLSKAIRRTANHLKNSAGGGAYAAGARKYSYEEWVEYTQLIRFTTRDKSGEKESLDEEVDDELVAWDWIGEDSPMMARVSEPEFVLDRLCESMARYIRKVAKRESARGGDGGGGDAKRGGEEKKSVVADDDDDDDSSTAVPVVADKTDAVAGDLDCAAGLDKEIDA